MNNSTKNRPTLVTLYNNDAGLGAGDIPLSQPFTNFSNIMFVHSNDGKSYKKCYTYETWVLDYNLSLDKPCLIGDTSTYWQLSNYANGTTSTFFKKSSENSCMFSIFGYNIS